ncbi:unnamed protein product [Moneuplotes crassus]|uniref:VPS9 domain-containing protein n=1 Tax=Euplotes crassus TaxID=5936 RepID=A0AAD1UMX6_EUPCR|nr:unnamed protein product [Moneuplotes crassus]
MSEPLTLISHLEEIQHCLKKFSQLGENKYENITSKIDDLCEKSQKCYTSKINYLAIASKVNDGAEKAKSLLFDKEITNIYSYSVITQIKEMLKLFKNDPYSFRMIIRDVILNWKRDEQIELSECLVNCFLCQHDSSFPLFPLAERLYDIIDVDMQILSEKGRLDSFLYSSFSMRIFDQISKLPESQNYIKQTMGKIFEKLDLDYLETIDLEDAAFNLKLFQKKGSTEVEEDQSNREFDIMSSMASSRKDSENSNTESDFILPLHKVKSTNEGRPTSKLPYQLSQNLELDEDSKFLDIPGNQAYHRTVSISDAKGYSEKDILKKIKDLKDKLDFSKLILKTILNALYVTQKYVPMIIRIFLKSISELYQKHNRINCAFYNKSMADQSDNSGARDGFKIKNELYRLLVEILASKWLVNSIFIHPDHSGLITNRRILKLNDIFLKYSKIFIHSLRGPAPGKNTMEESFMTLFHNFIEDQHKHGKRFVKSILNISIGEIIPKGIRTDQCDEFNQNIHLRKYRESPLLDVYCISEGLIHKLFYSYSSQKDNIKNSKLENAITTLECLEEYEKMFTKRIDSLKQIEEEVQEHPTDEFDINIFEEDNPKENTEKLLKSVTKEMNEISGKEADRSDSMNHQNDPTAKGVYDIYFYLADNKKYQKANGIQFITDRFIKKYKEYVKNFKPIEDQSEANPQSHIPPFEENKESFTEELEKDIEIKKMKFEKFMLLLLLGSCELKYNYSLRSKYANDFKEIISMIKINKINELKRLNKTCVNYEILVDMVKDPVDIKSFILTCLPELKKETDKILQEADGLLYDIQNSCERLDLQIEMLKSDLENLDFIICNEIRMKFIQQTDIPVCIQYFANSNAFKVVDTKKCSECLRRRQMAKLSMSKKISAHDIYFSSSPRLRETETERDEDSEPSEENKNMRHESFKRIDPFMAKFFELPIFENTEADPIKELEAISETYQKYLEKIKEKVCDEPQMRNTIEENVACINNLISTKYAKYEKIRPKIKNLDFEMNQKFYEIRYTDFVPKKLNHSVWKKPIKELKNMSFEESPHQKMTALIKCLTAISRAYLLLSDQSDEVTADDILQFSSFIFIKSGINDLAGYLEYIKAFHYTPKDEMQGIGQYCFITAQSCLEYLKKMNLQEISYDHESTMDFEITFGTPDEFTITRGTILG